MAASDVEQQSLFDRFSNSNNSDDDDNDKSAMSLVEHLEELRKRIFVCLIFVAIGTVVAFLFRTQLIAVLTRPLPLNANTLGGTHKLTLSGMGEGFTVAIKLSIIFGLVFSLPVIFMKPGRLSLQDYMIKKRSMLAHLSSWASYSLQ